jgi:hypothetical protein
MFPLYLYKWHCWFSPGIKQKPTNGSKVENMHTKIYQIVKNDLDKCLAKKVELLLEYQIHLIRQFPSARGFANIWPSINPTIWKGSETKNQLNIFKFSSITVTTILSPWHTSHCVPVFGLCERRPNKHCLGSLTRLLFPFPLKSVNEPGRFDQA